MIAFPEINTRYGLSCCGVYTHRVGSRGSLRAASKSRLGYSSAVKVDVHPVQTWLLDHELALMQDV
jgi:hypothetical protein